MARDLLVHRERGAKNAHQSFALAGGPEPATWAMMIMGFGLMGATLRSRRLAQAAI